MKKGLSKKLACLVTLITVTSNTIAFAQDINKDETVYVILDENGNPTEQIVSDWIKGSENLGKFSDKSTLSDIKNVKGEEEPVKNGDELTWEVNSKELYYQGKSNNKLPITVWVDYEFNGKKVNPNEVLGQKGNFKISVNITNNESKTTFIKGEKRTLYLPILTAAEITLSNTKFSNLKVTSGKVMDDGNNSLVTFVTIPGLKESLKIGDLLDIAANVDIVKKSGSWYNYQDIKLGQGRENVKKFLADNIDLTNEIEEKVRKYYKLGPEYRDLEEDELNEDNQNANDIAGE